MAWIMERTGARGTTYMGVYRDPDGHKRSAGSFSTRREAQRAANREEQKVLAGSWHHSSLGDITFREYVETEWLPNKHVEASTRAAYVSNLGSQARGPRGYLRVGAKFEPGSLRVTTGSR